MNKDFHQVELLDGGVNGEPLWKHKLWMNPVHPSQKGSTLTLPLASNMDSYYVWWVDPASLYSSMYEYQWIFSTNQMFPWERSCIIFNCASTFTFFCFNYPSLFHSYALGAPNWRNIAKVDHSKEFGMFGFLTAWSFIQPFFYGNEKPFSAKTLLKLTTSSFDSLLSPCLKAESYLPPHCTGEWWPSLIVSWERWILK